MAVKIESLKVGDILYDVHRQKAGNTTMSYEGVWEVRVVAVGPNDHGRQCARLSWNGNRAGLFRDVPRGYKRHPKEWVAGYESVFGHGARRGRKCYMCGNFEHQGHDIDCTHPRAEAKRRKAALPAAPA